MFDITVERWGSRKCFEAFSPKHIVFTYTEAKAQIEKVAAWLYAQGIRKGDRVS